MLPRPSRVPTVRKDREHALPLRVNEFCSEVGLGCLNSVESHLDIAQIAHFTEQIASIHDENS
jgi:hypothetical protein